MKFWPSKKTRKLWLLRWDRIKQSPAVWILFVACLACSFVLNALIDDNSEASVLKALIVVCNNICYGYIAGFVFYVLSQFLPDTSKELEANVRIVSNVDFILNTMTFFEREVFGERYVEGQRDDMTLACFMVVEPAARVHFIEKDARVFTIRPEVGALMDICRDQIKDKLHLLLMQDNKWLDDYAPFLLVAIDSFFSKKDFVAEGECSRVLTSCLQSRCSDFYMGKLCLEKYKERLMRYYYL